MNRPEDLIRRLPPELHWHTDGEIRLVGHRIGFYHFVFYMNQGFTAEMLHSQFPTLDLPLIQKVIAFYSENRQAIAEYAAQYQAELDRLRAAGWHAPSVIELKTHLDARQRAEAIDAA